LENGSDEAISHDRKNELDEDTAMTSDNSNVSRSEDNHETTSL
jgi:hypothetical protein